MKIKRIKTNVTEINLRNGLTVLYSYDTPVAVRYGDGTVKRTEKKWSVTTSKHINAWVKSLGVSHVGKCTQDFLDFLTEGY